MSQSFSLIKEKICKVHQEKQWTYCCLSPFNLNKAIIEEITITDHYQLEHKEIITNELILELLTYLPPRINPRAKHDKREIFVWEYIYQNNKEYRLIFWFDDNSDNHLWIRNCYPIN